MLGQDLDDVYEKAGLSVTKREIEEVEGAKEADVDVQREKWPEPDRVVEKGLPESKRAGPQVPPQKKPTQK